MTLDELLRSAAQDMAERAPDGGVDTAGIRSRAQRVRVRRRAGAAAGLVAATVLAAVGLQAVGGSRAEPDPVEPPSPTPSIGVDDLGEYEELATVTNAQPGNEGLTELRFEVPVRDRFAYEWSHFCSGDPEVWYVLTIGDGGGGSGPCDNNVPETFPTFPTDISPFRHSEIASSGTVDVRIFVTGPLRQGYLDCLDKKSTSECRDLEPEPLGSADVTFGVSVYEYWAPAVAEVAGERIGALASADGVDYVLRDVVSFEPGQPGVSATLPATSGRHLVSVIDQYTAETVACATAGAKKGREEELACLPVLELVIGDRTVLLDRGEFGDYPMIGGPHGLFRVPVGERRIEARVASGPPDGSEYALLVFEERP